MTNNILTKLDSLLAALEGYVRHEHPNSDAPAIENLLEQIDELRNAIGEEPVMEAKP